MLMLLAHLVLLQAKPTFDPSQPFCTAGVCRDAPRLVELDARARSLRLAWIHAEVIRLEGSRPSQVLPGVSLALGCIAAFAAGIVGALRPLNQSLYSLALIAGASLPITFGIVFLSVNGGRNRRIDAQVKPLREERNALTVLEL